jgi:hypothetical protein
MSADRVRDLIPLVHVSDVARSVAFYELVGFEVKDGPEARDGPGRPGRQVPDDRPHVVVRPRTPTYARLVPG